MTLIADPPAVMERFDQICTLIGADRNGITLAQLRDAHALARELEEEDSDRNRVAELAAALGIEVEALTTVAEA